MAGTSRIAFGPAQTTATGVRASSSRSDEMSRLPSAPSRARRDGRRRSRPSRRPRIPAACAAIMVAETVVAAQPPAASAMARLGRAALRTEPAGAVASASSPAGSRPTSIRPSWIATVAGMAPARADRGLGGGRDLEVLRGTAGRG